MAPQPKRWFATPMLFGKHDQDWPASLVGWLLGWLVGCLGDLLGVRQVMVLQDEVSSSLLFMVTPMGRCRLGSCENSLGDQRSAGLRCCTEGLTHRIGWWWVMVHGWLVVHNGWSVMMVKYIKNVWLTIINRHRPALISSLFEWFVVCYCLVGQ